MSQHDYFDVFCCKSCCCLYCCCGFFSCSYWVKLRLIKLQQTLPEAISVPTDTDLGLLVNTIYRFSVPVWKYDSSVNLLCIVCVHTLFLITSCVDTGLPAIKPVIVQQQVPSLPQLISRETDSDSKFESHLGVLSVNVGFNLDIFI